jgi:Tol biopolymer transport system component
MHKEHVMKWKKKALRWAGVAVAAAALLLGGCGGLLGPSDDDGGDGPETLYESVTLTVSAGGVGFSPQAIQQGPDDILSAELIIVGEDRFGNFQNPLVQKQLTESGGVWQTTESNLPAGTPLDFTVNAYDGQNLSGAIIYSGTLQQRILSTGTNNVSVPLDPAVPADPIAIPVVESITRPAEIPISTDATVRISLRGTPGENLDVTISAGGGSFNPAGFQQLEVSQYGRVTAETTYSAPAAGGDYTHVVAVTNSQGNSVETQFVTTVIPPVYGQADMTLSTSFAPAVTSITTERQGTSVFWEAFVADDGPQNGLVYVWRLYQDGGTPGAFFYPEVGKRSELNNYDHTVYGTVRLFVEDNNGGVGALQTTVDIQLEPHHFPDDVVLEVNKIAFVSPDSQDYWIHVMNPDGSGRQQLATTGGDDDDLLWSPDGSRIAFNRGGDIWVMNGDGSNQVNLADNQFADLEYAWSPDGSTIAFTSRRVDGDAEIYVINADGTNEQNLTDNDISDSSPAWSPDGSKIAFTSMRDGYWDVFVMNSDGTGRQNLTNHDSGEFDPAWSPDGSKIAFESDRDGYTEIYVMEADGSSQPYRLTNSSAGNYDPVWSPDGSLIAFESYRLGDFEIYVADPGGSFDYGLTNNSSDDTDPVWSPDGSQIAFVSERDGSREIYLMDANGENEQQLTDTATFASNPVWSRN